MALRHTRNRTNKDAARLSWPDKGSALLVSALATYLAWVFFVRFSDLLFADSTETAPSLIFTLCAVVVLAPFLVFDVARGRANDDRLVFYSICAALSAVAATVIPVVPQMTGLVESPRALVLLRDCLAGIAGMAAGLSFGAASAVGLALLRRYPVASAIRALATAFTSAVVAVYLINLWLPAALKYLIAVLPLLSLTLVIAARQYKLGEVEAQVVPPKAARNGGRLLPVLLFATSFLAVYMIAMFPRTTQLAPNFYANVINGMSVHSILMLVLCSLLFVLAASLLSERRRHAFVAILVMLGLFAASFYFLPSMPTSAIPFVLITPLAIMLMLVALALLVFMAPDLATTLRSGFIAVSVGALLAGCFGAVFMGPLYGRTAFHERLFDLIPAMLIIVSVALLLAARKECLALFFPGAAHPVVEYPDDLDTSAMESRCAILTQACGLTARESEVLELLSIGRNEPFVADALMVSKTTVKTHIAHIYQKTGVSNRQELIDLLHARGMAADRTTSKQSARGPTPA
ncbi:MAG: helix-turn-helix transcriptional regulator [Bifidobacteriaceae bacterium]|nr:helix-turn-helix transcriptional regulator [Bifidobacteriaceae bacterium]